MIRRLGVTRRRLRVKVLIVLIPKHIRGLILALLMSLVIGLLRLLRMLRCLKRIRELLLVSLIVWLCLNGVGSSCKRVEMRGDLTRY